MGSLWGDGGGDRKGAGLRKGAGTDGTVHQAQRRRRDSFVSPRGCPVGLGL